MCGILGFVSAPGGSVDLARFNAALNSMRHRGPDDEGFLVFASGQRAARPYGGADTPTCLELPRFSEAGRESGNVVLGHRRLSIVDLSPAGHQPMRSQDGGRWIVFNGEIYNHIDLRRELEGQGYGFRTRSDTEVLLAAYDAWGEAMLPRLIGMFAFAILDIAAGDVFIARDNFGIKPLYYTVNERGFAWSSEIKGLLECQPMARRADPQQLFQYLRFGEREAAPQTLFEGVKRLPAGHCLRLPLADPGSFRLRSWWTLAPETRNDLSLEAAAGRVRELFDQSVELHMRSDVPVGACLSGGLDSTAIVMAMQRHLSPGQPLHTFSFISDDPVLSEEPYVDMVPGTIKHKVSPQPRDLVHDLDDLMRAQELPFGSLSIYAQFRVFRLAQEAGVKVVLDGQGSDEIFAGYYSLIGARISGLLSGMRLLSVLRILSQAPENARSVRMRMLLTSAWRVLPSALQLRLLALAGEPVYPSWLSRGWFEGRHVMPTVRAHGRGRHALREELLLGIEHLSLPQLLRYEDYNSMFFSIESRVPFCTPALAEFAVSLPEEYLISNPGETKCVFRRAIGDTVPGPILTREKVGFTTPDREWLGAQRLWVEALLESPSAREAGFVDQAALKAMITQTLNRGGYWPPHVWRCLNVFAWANAYQVSWN